MFGWFIWRYRGMLTRVRQIRYIRWFHQNLLLPTCIVSSIYDCYGAGIVLSTRYICTAAMGILCWAIWIRLFTPSIHKICMKNMSFTTHPHEHYFASQLPTTYWTTPDDRHNNKHDICAALAYWCTSVVWSVSIKMRDLVLVWYTHNNQPCNEEGEGET